VLLAPREQGNLKQFVPIVCKDSKLAPCTLTVLPILALREWAIRMIQLQHDYETTLGILQLWHAQFQSKAVQPMRVVKDREVIAAIARLEDISTRLTDKATDIAALVSLTERRLNQGGGSWIGFDDDVTGEA